MFLTFLGENRGVKCYQTSLSPQSPQTYFKSSTHVYIYHSSYYIFFREKFFPDTIMLWTRFSQMPKIQIYSENAIMITNVFK